MSDSFECFYTKGLHEQTTLNVFVPKDTWTHTFLRKERHKSMDNFQQFWSTTKRNVMLLSLHTSVDECSIRLLSSSPASAIDSLKEDIIQFLVTPWGILLSSSIWNWLSKEAHYPVSSDSLGKNIIQLHLQLTLMEKTFFSFFWRSGGRHYPAPSGIDSLKKNII